MISAVFRTISLTLAVLAFTLSTVAVQAAELKPNDVVPVMDGQVLSRIAIIEGQKGMTVIQYVADNESFQKWNRLVVYSNVRSEEVGNDPKNLVLRLVAALQQRTPGAKYKVAGTEDGQTVLLDFLTWAADKSYLEFTVYRLEKGAEGKGVYSVQMTRRLPYFDEITDDVKKTMIVTRASMLEQVAKFNMPKVKELLDAQAK